MVRSFAILLLAAGLGYGVLSGCSKNSGPELTPVSGKVMFEGKPVENGTVSFLPTDDNGAPATGTVDSSGNFEMSTHSPGDGVKPGSYQVAVTIEKTKAYGDDKGQLHPPTYLSPERYHNPKTSGFTVTVEQEAQSVEFDLKP